MSAEGTALPFGPEQALRLGLLFTIGVLAYVLCRAGETLDLKQPKVVPLPAEKHEEAVRLLASMMRGTRSR